MACGGCGQRRAKQTSAADGRKTVYVVTWGDGTREDFATTPMARVAMAKQDDPAKRRGMHMTTKRA
jgi:hypothetical protein